MRFGDVHRALTGSRLLGAIPAACLGARVSSRAFDRLARPVLATGLVGSSLELSGVDTVSIDFVVTMMLLGSPLALRLRRRARAVGGAPRAAPERGSRAPTDAW